MRLVFLGLLVVAVAISTSSALRDDAAFLRGPHNVAASSLKDVYDETFEEQLQSYYINQAKKRKIIHCVIMIAKHGLKSTFVECESYLKDAVKYCKQHLGKDRDVGARQRLEHETCREMLAILKTEGDMCGLRGNGPGNRNCESVAVSVQVDSDSDEPPKKKVRVEKCSDIPQNKGMCKAGELYGQRPGNTGEQCIPYVEHDQSSTWQVPVQNFDSIVSEANNAANDDENILAQVFTLPIGQGDCNIIKCDRGKTAIIFDCGSLGGNTLKGEEFESLVSSFLNGAEALTILISHGDRDHKSMIGIIRQSFKGNPKIIFGGTRNDFKPAIDGEQVADESGEIKVKNLCNNQDITFTLVQGNISPSNRNKNERGMMMKLSSTAFDSSLLFTADMEGNTARAFATNSSYSEFLQSTHYKMAHHGASDKANHKEWLEAIRPVEVHVSHQYNGRFHHPRCEAFNRLMEVGSVGMASKAPGAKPHNLACFGEKNDYKAYDQCVYHRIFSTGPRENKICMIVMYFIAGKKATTDYYCRDV